MSGGKRLIPQYRFMACIRTKLILFFCWAFHHRNVKAPLNNTGHPTRNHNQLENQKEKKRRETYILKLLKSSIIN